MLFDLVYESMRCVCVYHTVHRSRPTSLHMDVPSSCVLCIDASCISYLRLTHDVYGCESNKKKKKGPNLKYPISSLEVVGTGGL